MYMTSLSLRVNVFDLGDFTNKCIWPRWCQKMYLTSLTLKTNVFDLILVVDLTSKQNFRVRLSTTNVFELAASKVNVFDLSVKQKKHVRPHHLQRTRILPRWLKNNVYLTSCNFKTNTFYLTVKQTNVFDLVGSKSKCIWPRWCQKMYLTSWMLKINVFDLAFLKKYKCIWPRWISE